MNQWMFCFDGFGIRYQQAGQNMEGDQEQEDRQDSEVEQDSDETQIFQPYLAKFMCNVRDEGIEGGEGEDNGDGEADRFVFYNVKDQDCLKEETNFDETLPREVSRFISKEELDETVQQDGGSSGEKENQRNLVRAYAKTLQQLFDTRNVKMMKLDVEGADAVIERDFDAKK